MTATSGTFQLAMGAAQKGVASSRGSGKRAGLMPTAAWSTSRLAAICRKVCTVIVAFIVMLTLRAGLRVEWCKARARALRWIEEVEILDEEMRRTKRYYIWWAQWRAAQAALPRSHDLELVEGAAAYAHRQASIRQRMHDFCERAWGCVRAWICLGHITSDEFHSEVPSIAHRHGSSSEDDLPSLRSISASSIALQSVLEDAQDVVDVEIAMEDFD